MRTNELRIGNYVNYKNPDYENIPRIIDYTAKPNLVGLERVSVNHIPYNKIEPIPLTEEWLLKFGFVEKDYESEDYSTTYYEYNGFILKLDYEPYDYDIKYKLEYVHQLQNLYFALTNQELTIKE